MIRLFVGYDPREAAAYHTFCQSVIEHASVPVAFIPLHRSMLEDFDGQRDGTNAFIYSRYLIPLLCQFTGWAMFADGDMLARADIAELWALRNPRHAVSVVPHSYQTAHPRKYVGTPLESDNLDYHRKNWSSLMLWNCGHPRNSALTREVVQTASPQFLHQFQWLKDGDLGELPGEWNHLVREYEPREAKLRHYTLGVPGFWYYRQDEGAIEWAGAYLRAVHLIGENPMALTRWASEMVNG